MITTNPTVTADWTLVVPDTGQDFLLSMPFDSPIQIEVATSAHSGVAPVVRGHMLSDSKRESINRNLLGPGAVFARCHEGAVDLALNAWSSSLLLFPAGTWDTSATWLTDRTWS